MVVSIDDGRLLRVGSSGLEELADLESVAFHPNDMAVDRDCGTERGPRGRVGGRPTALTGLQVIKAREMYDETDENGKRRYTVAQIAETSASHAKPSTATSTATTRNQRSMAYPPEIRPMLRLPRQPSRTAGVAPPGPIRNRKTAIAAGQAIVVVFRAVTTGTPVWTSNNSAARRQDSRVRPVPGSRSWMATEGRALRSVRNNGPDLRPPSMRGNSRGAALPRYEPRCSVSGPPSRS